MGVLSFFTRHMYFFFYLSRAYRLYTICKMEDEFYRFSKEDFLFQGIPRKLRFK